MLVKNMESTRSTYLAFLARPTFSTIRPHMVQSNGALLQTAEQKKEGRQGLMRKTQAETDAQSRAAMTTSQATTGQ